MGVKSLAQRNNVKNSKLFETVFLKKPFLERKRLSYLVDMASVQAVMWT